MRELNGKVILSMNVSKTGASLAATALFASAALAGCSSDSSAPAPQNTDGRGPITFAMGKK